MTWTDKTYNETLKASNELVGLAMELNERLGAGGGATSPEAVLVLVKRMRELLDVAKDNAEFETWG